MKIVFANTLMEISHKIPGTNVNDVTSALKIADHRLISPRYLDGGMGDGGGCHPRDNIAMSWLARQLPLSHDFFADLMMAREHQTEWLADLMCAYDLPKAIVGYSFKSGTNRIVGSPALLLKTIFSGGARISTFAVRPLCRGRPTRHRETVAACFRSLPSIRNLPR